MLNISTCCMSFLECASFLIWVLEGHCLFKKRALRTAPKIIALRLVMNPSHKFCSYPYYFPNKQAFPYENVGVGDPLLRGPIGSSPFDASLPWPTVSWKRSAVLDASDPVAEKETLTSWLNSLRQNYCCFMGMGIPSSPGGNISHLNFLLSLPFLCSYAAEPALTVWKLSTYGGSYKQSRQICSALASGRRTHQ